MKLANILFFIFFLILGNVSAQEKVHDTFKDTRVINTHSVETLKKGHMDIRIGHRFGDFAGSAGGWRTFYGLENAADISIGAEYGLSDALMVGLHRAKGAGPLRQNIVGLAKYRIMQQTINKNGFSLSILGMASISTMPKSLEPGVPHFFEKFAHRVYYNVSFLFSKKFSNRFSLQAHGGWTYRNLVPSTDVNDLVSAGLAFRLQLTKVMGLIFDSNFGFNAVRPPETDYFPAIGVGLEWDTGGGHVFQLNMTNARGIFETDYIPNNLSNWGEGEYRLGFTIARQFKI